MKLVLRKLSQPNCRPCAVVAQYLTTIADELTQLGAVITEHDVAAEPQVAAKYGVMSVPVLVVERNGHEMARLTGLVSPAEILDAVQAAKEARR